MPSFDVVSRVEMQEVDNAISNSMKEIGQRYDFKGSASKLERAEGGIILLSCPTLGAGDGFSDGVTLKRGAGDGWRTFLIFTKLSRAFMCL